MVETTTPRRKALKKRGLALANIGEALLFFAGGLMLMIMSVGFENTTPTVVIFIGGLCALILSGKAVEQAQERWATADFIKNRYN